MPVGKSCAQVTKEKDGKMKGSDSDIYEKWSQAISSAFDLIRTVPKDIHAYLNPPLPPGAVVHSIEVFEYRETVSTFAVIPALVLPDGLLWKACYDSDGNFVPPEPADRVTYFIDKTYSLAGCLVDTSSSKAHTISHLEIFTVAGLRDFLSRLTGNGRTTRHLWNTVFGHQH